MKVFLTGSTGFVGSHLLRRLLRDGHTVRALVRSAGAQPASERLDQVAGDVTSGDLGDRVAGCDAVIHLVGIIQERGTATFDRVHRLGTHNVVQAARAAGVGRFVQMSALGTRPGNASRYHTTKFAAEEEVRNSGLPWVILRPSLIFGPGSAFVKQMIEVMRAAPLVRPVPGTGEYKFRPVHIDDVVECFVQSLTNEAALGQTIDLVGGEEVTLNEITRRIAQAAAVKKAVVHIPMPLMRLAARAFGLLPISAPVTLDQLRMLEEGSTASPEPMQRVFGISPTGFQIAEPDINSGIAPEG